MKSAINRALRAIGYQIVRTKTLTSVRPPGGSFRSEFKQQDERHFFGRRGSVSVSISPAANYPQAMIEVRDGDRRFEQMIELSHLALAKLVTEYDFETVLDIGSGWGAAARCFQFLGKRLQTVEVVDNRTEGVSMGGDYLSTPPLGPFDLVWASHVLEHQRNVGAFLDKVFTDTREGGIVAITVPSALSPIIIGHPSIFTPMHLIYHLVLAGFDCSEARVKQYDWQFTVIVKKKPSGVERSNIAATHYPLDAPSFHPELLRFFPIPIPEHGHAWGELDGVNW